MGYEIRQGLEISKWFEKVKDRSVKIKLLARLARVENGILEIIKIYLKTFLSLDFILAQDIGYTTRSKMTLLYYSLQVVISPAKRRI